LSQDVSISTLAYEYPRGFHVPEHAHGADQLIYATGGVMEVLHVTPLLRELIVEAVRMGNLRARNRLHVALRDLLTSQLQSASPVSVSL